MKLFGVLGSVPAGYNQTEDEFAKRHLNQQTYDTNQRQAPLQDRLLQAQIDHLRKTAAHSGLANQFAQRKYQDEIGGSDALMRAILASGQTSAVPQPPQPPQVPPNLGQTTVPTEVVPNPTGGIGAVSAELNNSVAAGGSGSGGLPVLPPQQVSGLPAFNQGPVGGAAPMPQQGQDPRMAQLQQVLKALQASPNPAQRAAGLQLYLQLQEALSKSQHRDLAGNISQEQLGLANRREQRQEGHEEYSQARGQAALKLQERGQNLNFVGKDVMQSPEQRAQNFQQFGGSVVNKDQARVDPLSKLPAQDAAELKAVLQSYGGNIPIDKTIMLNSGKQIRVYKGTDGTPHIDLVE